MQWAVLSSFILVLITVYVPFLRPFFNTTIIGLKEWVVMLPGIIAAPVVAEIVKYFIRIDVKKDVAVKVRR
jgi:Ca2+-transporting ATPase